MLGRPGYFQLVSAAGRSYRRTMGWFAVSNQLGGVTGTLGMSLVIAAGGYVPLGWTGIALCATAVGLVAASNR